MPMPQMLNMEFTCFKGLMKPQPLWVEVNFKAKVGAKLPSWWGNAMLIEHSIFLYTYLFNYC